MVAIDRLHFDLSVKHKIMIISYDRDAIFVWSFSNLEVGNDKSYNTAF